MTRIHMKGIAPGQDFVTIARKASSVPSARKNVQVHARYACRQTAWMSRESRCLPVLVCSLVKATSGGQLAKVHVRRIATVKGSQPRPAAHVMQAFARSARKVSGERNVRTSVPKIATAASVGKRMAFA